ncbi:MAG: SDR family NAD(P)-dependent oxidoreductase [Brevundimonas sp.]|jgi:uncharacterized protein|uniref:SDR family NAD(P)-dependent oxidoreductase n=1 Tax=Brevundimonas sp. TaxID=1871086 RepID=UPI00391B225A
MRTALITGASAGLGAAFARQMAARGWALALTARRADRLDQLRAEIEAGYGVPVSTFPLDLSAPGAAQDLFDQVGAAGLRPAALINNAGFSRTEGFARTPWPRHEAMVRLMLEAPLALSHLCLPAMKAEGFGRILNVCSLAGFMPATGGDTLYGPIKSFLIKASMGLHMEVREHGIHVSALCPGYVLTEFHDANGSREQVSAAYPAFMWMSAEDVVRQGLEALEANRPVQIPGRINSAIAGIVRALPDSWGLALAARHARRLGRAQS